MHPVFSFLFISCKIKVLSRPLLNGIMIKLFATKIGKLRIIAFLEGISLLTLFFIAMPLKYMFDRPEAVRINGAIHGGLFLLFVFYTLVVALEQNWKHGQTTWKVLLSSFIPFGTFYIDKTILSKII